MTTKKTATHKARNRKIAQEYAAYKQEYQQTVQFCSNVILGFGVPIFRNILIDLNVWKPTIFASNKAKLILTYLCANTIFGTQKYGKQEFIDLTKASEKLYEEMKDAAFIYDELTTKFVELLDAHGYVWEGKVAQPIEEKLADLKLVK